MQLDTLRMIVGFSIIASHLVSFAIVLFSQELTLQEKTELSLLISPIFAVYVTAIVRRFTNPDPEYDRTPTHPALRILSIGSSTIFSIATPIIVYLFISGGIESFAALKTTIGIVETALGIYTGAVIDRLFGGSPRVGQQPRPVPRNPDDVTPGP